MSIIHTKNINPLRSTQPEKQDETEVEKQIRLLRNDNKTLRKENKEIKDLLQQLIDRFDEE